MNLDDIFPLVRKPSRYIGNEFNIVNKEWDSCAIRVALVFPDLYEIGMSHQGLQILYHILNSKNDILTERAFVPDTDMEDLLRQERKPVFSLESGRPLGDFDIIGFTLPYELCYTNILTMLDLSEIPFRSSERNDTHPLIIGGGSCSCNPEPVADFFDAILLGDGEEAIVEMMEIIQNGKLKNHKRSEILNQLSAIPGVYVPSFFKPVYDDNGGLKEIRSLREGYERVQRRVLPDLECSQVDVPPLVPLVKTVHDRLGVEIARGCTRGCRFCQAGMIYRPVRERSPHGILKLAEKGIESGGFDEMALLSLSTGDYSCLPELLGRLMDDFAEKYVSVSMPSMRVGTLTEDIMSQIRRVRKTGFTVAPEAGTDRLRRVINKGITEEDLLETCRGAFELGWKMIKFYFMFGLPTETEDDIQEIANLASKALGTSPQKGRSVTVSVGTFVPKPHTPFQWEPQLSIEEGFARIDLLKKNLPKKGVKLKWQDPRQSFLEGVFSRGDRRLSRLVETAWNMGARLDGWSEHYDIGTWRSAAEECGIQIDSYLRLRNQSEILPWDHLSSGVEDEFLKDEYEKALQEAYTPDCRVNGCQKCGLCDFKVIKPIIHSKSDDQGSIVLTEKKSGKYVDQAQKNVKHYLYRITYSRLEAARFVGHLELIQIFFRIFRRVGLPLNFSQGFNPSPKISFSPALPVGTESIAEYMDVDLSKTLTDTGQLMVSVNEILPEGFNVTGIETLTSLNETDRIMTCYKIVLVRNSGPDNDIAEKLKNFMGRSSYKIFRTRKGKKKELDVRPMIKKFVLEENGSIELILESETGRAACKPVELLQSVLLLNEREVASTRILKRWWKTV